MAKYIGLVAFLLTILSLLLYGDWLYSVINMSWAFVPSILVIWLLSFFALVLSIFGLKYKPNWKVRLRNWITLSFSLVLTIGLSFPLTHQLTTKKSLIESTVSELETYRINVMHLDGGIYGPKDRILAELEGPLWFKKPIYLQYHETSAEVLWTDYNIISINGGSVLLDAKVTFPSELDMRYYR